MSAVLKLPDRSPELREIVLLANANRMLAEARTIDEVKEIRDQAEALRLYLKQRDAGLEAQNMAAEIKVRAERRIGQLLLKRENAQGKRNDLTCSDGLSKSTLADIGITYNQSSEWQSLASLPEPEFEQHIAETKAEGKEITTAGVLRIAKQSKAPEPSEPEDWTLHESIRRLNRVVKAIAARWPRDRLKAMGNQLVSLGEELLENGELRP